VTQRRWDDDQHLLDDLTEAFRETARSADAIAAKAAAAFSWRALDEELMLACLSFDSSLDRVGDLRSEPDDARILVFSAAPLTVELEVTPQRIVGQVVPPAAAEILVEAADGAAVRVEADELGFFVVSPLPGGPVRLRCDTSTGRVVTDWVRL
jgi:hypothetical protein